MRTLAQSGGRRLSLFGLIALTLANGACRSAPFARLKNPNPSELEKAAPDSFIVTFTTSKGPFDVMIRRPLAPKGADRLHFLVNAHYYDGVRFFRVVKGFMAQFGLHGDSGVTSAWRSRRIVDDTVKGTNARGTITFATGGPNTRTTQLFINLVDNRRLDASGFAPLGSVVNGMAVVDSLYDGYGEGAPRGGGPDQGKISREGNAYLSFAYPKLDSIVTARVTRRWP